MASLSFVQAKTCTKQYLIHNKWGRELPDKPIKDTHSCYLDPHKHSGNWSFALLGSFLLLVADESSPLLQNNQIEEIFPEELARLYRLETLNLQNNRLTSKGNIQDSFILQDNIQLEFVDRDAHILYLVTMYQWYMVPLRTVHATIRQIILPSTHPLQATGLGN